MVTNKPTNQPTETSQPTNQPTNQLSNVEATNMNPDNKRYPTAKEDERFSVRSRNWDTTEAYGVDRDVFVTMVMEGGVWCPQCTYKLHVTFNDSALIVEGCLKCTKCEYQCNIPFHSLYSLEDMRKREQYPKNTIFLSNSITLNCVRTAFVCTCGNYPRIQTTFFITYMHLMYCYV